MLWIGGASDLDVAEGYDPNDRRGKEGITMADIRWEADARPEGFLVGLAAPSVWRPAGLGTAGDK